MVLMSDYLNYKKKAIALRKAGNSYNEILRTIPVAKSTLSLWLRDVGLAKLQKQKLSAKRRAAQLKGARRRHEQRLEQTKRIDEDCGKDIPTLSEHDLFLLGIALYWAEGTKQKEYNPSVCVEFANSDPAMVSLFMVWLRKIAGVDEKRICATIHLHENHLERYDQIKKFWMKTASLRAGALGKPVIKRHNPKTKRKNKGSEYQGLLSIYVRESVYLNRQIKGWIHAIIDAQNRTRK